MMSKTNPCKSLQSVGTEIQRVASNAASVNGPSPSVNTSGVGLDRVRETKNRAKVGRGRARRPAVGARMARSSPARAPRAHAPAAAAAARPVSARPTNRLARVFWMRCDTSC